MEKPKVTEIIPTFLEIGKRSATGKISAFLELDQNGEPTGTVCLAAESDEDRTVLLRKIFPLLRGKKLTIIYERSDK